MVERKYLGWFHNSKEEVTILFDILAIISLNEVNNPIFVVSVPFSFGNDEQYFIEVLSEEVVQSLEIPFQKLSSAPTKAFWIQDHDNLLVLNGVEYFLEHESVENICLEPLSIIGSCCINNHDPFLRFHNTRYFCLAELVSDFKVALPGTFNQERIVFKRLFDDFQRISWQIVDKAGLSSASISKDKGDGIRFFQWCQDLV